MNYGSIGRWFSAIGAVVGIAAFTATSPAYADGNGCTMGSSCTLTIGGGGSGTCGFLDTSGGDYCVCNTGMFSEKTCACSTGEYPPCGGS